MFALKELGERSSDEELVAIVENNSCAVDAVQVITGCTFGKGNLIFKDYGKQVYTFIKRPSSNGVRISVEWESSDETEEEKQMWVRYMKGDRSDMVLKTIHNRRSKKIDMIMSARDEELLKVTHHVPILQSSLGQLGLAPVRPFLAQRIGNARAEFFICRR